MLQGRPKVIRGGRSATMVYSYRFTLARRAVVATMDLTAENLHLFRTNHWLKDAGNVCVVRLHSPAWVGSVGGSVPSTPGSRSSMFTSWTVGELASFDAQQDAEGIAAVVKRNAVTGRDLMAFTCGNDVQADLCVSPFLAKKLLSLRDAFVRGDAEAF